MNELFTYLFDEDVLKNKLREKWIKLYDFNFVDKDIIGGLLTTKKNISDLLTFIYNKATASNLPVDEKEKEATLNAPSIAPSTTLKTKTKGEERKDEKYPKEELISITTYHDAVKKFEKGMKFKLVRENEKNIALYLDGEKIGYVARYSRIDKISRCDEINPPNNAYAQYLIHYYNSGYFYHIARIIDK